MRMLCISAFGILVAACSASPDATGPRTESTIGPDTPPAASATATADAAVAPPQAQPFTVIHRAKRFELIVLEDALVARESKALLKIAPGPPVDITTVLDGMGKEDGLDFVKANFALRSMRGALGGELVVDVDTGNDLSNVGREFHKNAGVWSERVFTDAYKSAAYEERWLAETNLRSGGRLYERVDKGVVKLDVDGPKPSLMPVLTKGEAGCNARMVYHSRLAELPDGTIVGVGQACTDRSDRLGSMPNGAVIRLFPTKGPLAVEMWKPGEAKARFDVLPGKKLPAQTARADLFGDGATDLWLTIDVGAEDEESSQYLAHFDGTSWKEVTPDCALPVYFVAPRGAGLFCGDRVLVREGDSWLRASVDLEGDRGPFVSVEMVSNTVIALRKTGLFRLKEGERELRKLPLPDVDGATLGARSMVVSHDRKTVFVQAYAKKPNDFDVVLAFAVQ